MEIAYLIHSRTFKCDFNPNFMVRPANWNTAEIQWARRNILLATSSIETLSERRWLISSSPDGEYKIIGAADYIANLAQNCNQFITDSAAKFLKDEKNRRIYAFIGIVIHKSSAFDFEKITNEFLLEIYIKYLTAVWETNTNSTIEVPFGSLDFEATATTKNYPVPTHTFHNTALYASDCNAELIRYFSLSEDANFTLCTDITSAKRIEQLYDQDTNYIISTSSNILSRLKEPPVSEISEPLEPTITTVAPPARIETELLEMQKKNHYRFPKIYCGQY
ncbi:hypothetical protein [Candidatus Epulonipiscium viviparus]|uniref:hypothetical protein n=1 Tax=Candidatus Epulonipiscium viviparus TaxID=420336 RepID=UPI0027381232|nr:hypothetical protein [Candidatus Epulopiscium viviparus]